MASAPRARKFQRPARRSKPQPNPVVKAAILDAVENQLRDDNPTEVRLTLKRLTALGLSERRARLYIGTALLVEMNEVLRSQSPYDEARYVANLKRLPDIS